MSNKLAKTAADLLERAKDLQVALRPRITALTEQCSKLLSAAMKIADSWSGSSLGYHSELYYRDFEKPPLQDRFSSEWGGINGIPNGWQAREPEEVKNRIESLAGARFEVVDSETKQLLQEAQALQNDIVIELAPLHSTAGNERENSLLGQLEQFQWEKKIGEYIQANMPTTFMSRDQEAVSQGQRVSAHCYYEAGANVCESRCTAVDDFLKLSERLLRQVQIQAVGHAVAGQTTDTPIQLVKLICDRFHLVARQLTQRHQKRPAFEINDEYDVQDLLHALLRLHFDDIRPEEWTPSYGGGASRMDFLLKSEQIVVEAKMTRAGLGAREVTDQLTIDAARYRSHSDCKTLVCLVYDPAALVKNPRGIERDLSKLSRDGLEVVCVITP